MRTTIVLKDELARQVKKFADSRQLSVFINKCIEEHFAALRKKKQEEELISSYERANVECLKVAENFRKIETEGWPEW